MSIQSNVILQAEPQLVAETSALSFAHEEVLIPARFRLADHAHDAPHLCVVLDGAFQEDGVMMQRGVMRLSPAGDTHDLQFLAAGAHCFVLTINPALARDAPLPSARKFQNAHAVLPFIDQIRSRRARSVAGHELLVLEALARAALPAGVARRGRPPAWLERVRALLDEQACKPPSTATLAAEADRHPVYVARAFRAWFGCSLAAYTRLLRLDRAIRMTVETRESFARIAALAGFCDQSHLHRAIRERTGVTPRTLRRTQVARVQDFRCALR